MRFYWDNMLSLPAQHFVTCVPKQIMANVDVQLCSSALMAQALLRTVYNRAEHVVTALHTCAHVALIVVKRYL